MHPDDFIRSCNDVAISKALQDRTTSKDQKRQACMLYLANYKAWTRKAVALSAHIHTKVVSNRTYVKFVDFRFNEIISTFCSKNF